MENKFRSANDGRCSITRTDETYSCVDVLTLSLMDATILGSMPYERTNIHRLAAYTPGEQPTDLHVVKLNTNENPYPPAPAVLEAIRSVTGESLRRYPPPNADRFRKAAASLHGVSEEQVVATNGGDELLRLMVTAFCVPKGESEGVPASVRDTEVSPSRQGNAAASRGGVGVAEPSYSLYQVLAAIQDTPLTRVPLNDDWSLSADFADRLNAAGCRLAMVVNPHAPSGYLEPLEKIESIARTFQGVLLVDEAYVNFSTRDALPLLDPARGLDNVLLLRTLSKGYSLAGLRFGYGLGSAKLVAAINKVKDSYPTDVLAQAAAVAALGEQAAAKKTWQAVISERSRMTGELTRRGYRVYPSESNFILVVPPAHLRAGDTYESLKRRAILVRYFDQDRLQDKLRVTIGTPAENDALLKALDSM